MASENVLQKRYKAELKPKLQKQLALKNSMLVPSLRKIVISMGVAEAVKDKNIIQDCERDLTALSGQKPLITKAKKAIANFKLREGQPLGLKVTLRGKRMYDFLYGFVHIISPRIRDFRGFRRKGDGRGSYSLGLDDQQIFPEIDLNKVKRVQGMNITFVTSAKNDEECLALLEAMDMPFKKK